MISQLHPRPPDSSGTSQPILRVYLFGGLTLTWGDRPLTAIAGRTARSLFAYLVTRRGRDHTRDLLAGTFWPDLPDAQARRRLSHALWQIGRVLDPLPSPTPYLLTKTDTVRFDAEALYWLDTEVFERELEELRETRELRELRELRETRELRELRELRESRELGGVEKGAPRSSLSSLSSLGPLNSPGSPVSLRSLQHAIDLYRGDFLAGFYDDWAVVERERLRELYLWALNRLVAFSKAAGAYEEALHFVQRLIAEDPLHEEGHRELMRLYHLLNRDHEALGQYCLLYTSPSPRDGLLSRMPSSA